MRTIDISVLRSQRSRICRIWQERCRAYDDSNAYGFDMYTECSLIADYAPRFAGKLHICHNARLVYHSSHSSGIVEPASKAEGWATDG